MNSSRKITTGNNDRPRDETIAQSGPGVPDDSGTPVEVDEVQVERAKASLQEDPERKLKRQVADTIKSTQRGAE
ncbi:hypothetical protein [Phyllobacterium endophyticum]|uniref:hypothetical protein n=1 Tax=Phyllobacterium endophyticum TaxID=1149773 RepID=UPI0011C87E37|nr:hypothetical protein [Phyllobacterium endophyticum]TXR47847.1 hypothetical protein FVA77_17525 [Phyllobacterium endophyticum]